MLSHFVTSMTVPIASGWSDCRVGLSLTEKRRLSAAHAKNQTFPAHTENLASSLQRICRLLTVEDAEQDLAAFAEIWDEKYLAIQAAAKKWSVPIRNWNAAMNRFMIEFPERMPKTL